MTGVAGLITSLIIGIMNGIYLPAKIDSKKVKKILDRISEALPACIIHDNNEGLLNGYCGAALFYAYYYKLTGKKKHLLSMQKIVLKTIKALGEKELSWSLCSGIAGIAYCIQHLTNNEFIEQEGMEDIFSELDEHLYSYMKDELSNGHYDFLHEGLGVILYFLDKMPDVKAQQYLEEAVSELEKWSVKNEFGICWKDHFTQKAQDHGQPDVYNLGLAHGVPSIISVLCLLYEKNISVATTLPLIEGGIKWILSTRNEPSDDCFSLFPTIVSGDTKAIGDRQSRLGWCYGDLAIAMTLWNAGKRLQNEDYKKEAHTIFNYTAKYRNVDNGGIRDASLCHGTMCVSHIFRRMHNETGDSLYLEAAEHWLNESLNMATWKDGLAGFKYLLKDGYQNNYNLIEGITGIGLGLIAALDADTDPAWDRCLLLS